MSTTDQDIIQAARLRLLRAPHVRKINDFVVSKNSPNTAMPYFDPLDGGVNARVLVLLESPAHSGNLPRFVSRDNPTPTQANLKKFLSAASLDRADSVLWNAYPWLSDKLRQKRRLTRPEIKDGFEILSSVLRLPPELTITVLAGCLAQAAAPVITNCAPSVHILSTFHPIPVSLHTHPGRGDDIAATLKAARKILYEGSGSKK